MNRRHGLTIGIIIVLVLAAGVLAYFRFYGHRDSGVVTIKGSITSISNECAVDGTCSITIDGSKTIITGCGLRGDGTTCATYDQSKLKTGDRVSAKVIKTGDTYEVGCPDCTIQKL